MAPPRVPSVPTDRPPCLVRAGASGAHGLVPQGLHRARRLALVLLLTVLALAAGCATPARAADNPGSHVSLREVLRVLDTEYVAHDRLRPLSLLDGALSAASAAIPPLLYSLPDADGGHTLRVRVGTRAAQWDLRKVNGPAALAELLDAVRDFIVASLPPADRPARLNTLLVEGMLRALDPHSALLSAAAYGDFQSKASGRVGGLGMLLEQPAGHLTVEAVLPDSPAERAGVQAGDRILQIGEQAALHLPVEDALGLIRGRVGTRVDLLILRPHEVSPRQLTLRRSDLQFASVTSRVFREGGHERIGYLRVRSFQDTTTAELIEHLERLGAGRPGLLGIVLDLRDDPGGVLEQAIRVADLFLERGTIVTLRGPQGTRDVVPARWYRSVTSAPMIVLVDGGTASAAEVVAGALKYNHRALLLGAPTFGKNSIQSVFPLSGGTALKVTVARFFPVAGHSIEGRGIPPHIWLRPVHIGQQPGSDRGLLATALGTDPDRLAEADAGDAQPLREVPYLQAPPAGRPMMRKGPDRRHAPPEASPGDDYALALARRLLLLNAPQGQAVLLDQGLGWAQQERRRQDQAIARSLAARGVDWTPGNGEDGGQVELLHVELQTGPASGSKGRKPAAWKPLPPGIPVPTGTALRLRFTLRNAGALPLHRVLGISRSAAPCLNGLELPVGRIDPGQTVQVDATVALPTVLPQGLEPMQFRIYDGQRQLQYRATLLIPFANSPQARLKLALAVFDDGTGGSRGNGDGRAQPGELLALRVRLHNGGHGASGTGRFWLSANASDTIRLVRPWRPFLSVRPGGTEEDFLLFSVSAVPGPLAFQLNLLSDGLTAQELSWPFHLRLARPLPSLRLEAPRVELSVPDAAVADSQVTLSGTLRDETALRDVTVFRNGRKVIYQTTPDTARQFPLHLQVPLQPGRNLVRVVARDRNGLVGSRSYLLWQGSGAGFPLGSTGVRSLGGSLGSALARLIPGA